MAANPDAEADICLKRWNDFEIYLSLFIIIHSDKSTESLRIAIFFRILMTTCGNSSTLAIIQQKISSYITAANIWRGIPIIRHNDN